MPKQSRLRRRIRDLERQLVKSRHDAKVISTQTSSGSRRRRRASNQTRRRTTQARDTVSASDSSTITVNCNCEGGCRRRRCDCGDWSCGGCRRGCRWDGDCYGYGCTPYPYYGCGLAGPYPWAPAPFPTFPCMSILPGATMVETSCLPIY